ncbi:MAG: ABC transporter ATP-binding protein, partial [Xanthomonas perforans]|nr:ABC transporter ATP-binding protein [Xanthomonas perforans]
MHTPNDSAPLLQVDDLTVRFTSADGRIADAVRGVSFT